MGGAQDKEHAYGIPTRTAVVNDSDVPVPELDWKGLLQRKRYIGLVRSDACSSRIA